MTPASSNLPGPSFDGASLSGAQRAAVLIKCLPQKQAAVIVDRLRPRELQQLFATMRALPGINDGQYKTIVGEFIDSWKVQRHPAPAKNDSATQHSRDELNLSPFKFLTQIPVETRTHLLADKHPLNIAMLMSYLPTEVGADILNSLPPTNRVDVLKLLCEIDQFDSSDVAQFRYELQSELKKIQGETEPSAGVGMASRLLSCADEHTKAETIKNLRASHPGLAHQIGKSVFNFSDFEHLPARDVRLILAHTDTSCWAPALATAKSNVRKKILSCMAVRPRDILKSEIESLGEVHEQTSRLACKQIVQTVVKLIETGQLNFQDKSIRV